MYHLDATTYYTISEVLNLVIKVVTKNIPKRDIVELVDSVEQLSGVVKCLESILVGAINPVRLKARVGNNNSTDTGIFQW